MRTAANDIRKKILVTGAAGFIGSHLCEALIGAGYDVVGIDNFDPFYDRKLKEQNLEKLQEQAAFEFIEGDVMNIASLPDVPGDIYLVVHLAARAGVLPSLKNPVAYVQTNIEMTNRLLEWMRTREINKFVFASSSSVYGNNAKVPFEEEDKVDEPISPYAFTKRSCELMNYTYHSLYRFDIINLRIFTVYGERQRPDLAIRKFVKSIFCEEPLTIYGDGRTARDYTYYADTVQGFMAAIRYVSSNSYVYETVNLGNSSPVSLADLVHTIAKHAGKEPILEYDTVKPGDVDITYAGIRKAKKLLGYDPKVSLDTGIAAFIEWYRKHENCAAMK